MFKNAFVVFLVANLFVDIKLPLFFKIQARRSRIGVFLTWWWWLCSFGVSWSDERMHVFTSRKYLEDTWFVAGCSLRDWSPWIDTTELPSLSQSYMVLIKRRKEKKLTNKYSCDEINYCADLLIWLRIYIFKERSIESWSSSWIGLPLSCRQLSGGSLLSEQRKEWIFWEKPWWRGVTLIMPKNF